MKSVIRLLPLAWLLMLAACGAVDKASRGGDEAAGEAPNGPAELVEPLDPNRFPLLPDSGAVGEMQVTTAREEDTFVEFARTYGVGFDELRAANPGVDPWLPGEGTRIVLPTRFLLPNAPREGIVLNIAAKRLFFFPPVVDGEPPVVETFPIGIGRAGWATPTGETEVVAKARDPVWFVPSAVIAEHEAMGDPLPKQVPPGPDNPLGSRVMQLGLPGYLIHGTNKPAGVGMRVSHGCVRLFPEDIEYLYEQVPEGTPVRIVNQPLLLARDGDDLLLEAHTSLEEDERDWSADWPVRLERARASLDNKRAHVDEQRVTLIVSEQRGFPVSILDGGADTDSVLRNARQVENVIVHEQVVAADDD